MTDTAALPEELERAIVKFEASEARIAQNMGEGETVAGLAIARKHLPVLTEAIHRTLKRDLSPRYRPLKVELIRLPDEVIALACLQSIFHGIAHREPLRDIYMAVGNAIAGELWALEFKEWSDQRDEEAKQAKQFQPRIHAKVLKQSKAKHGNHAYRMQAARSLASKDGFKAEGRMARLLCGEFLTGVTQQALPEVFELSERQSHNGSPQYALTITDAALATIDDAIGEAVLSHPVWLPITQPPKPWTRLYDGGTHDPRLQPRMPFVRARHAETRKLVDEAMKSGQMAPVMEAVNALQGVPWVINKRVLGVMHECIRAGIAVPGLLSGALMEEVERPDWDALDANQRKAWRIRKGQIKLANLRLKSESCLQAEDLKTADRMAEHERFWTPMNLDWRGRVYPVPTFNFQRDDRVRALFLFADGEPVGEEGLYWLKVHVANCGDFDKISKQPFEERVRWTETNTDALLACAEVPLKELLWTKADKPFLFLAACFEYATALQQGDAFVTRLPVSFDGSCSGLQHLCAMTRAAEGSLVNLTSNPIPADVYQVVADRVKDRITTDTILPSSDTAALAEQCLAFGIDRKLVKRNVMTYSYSSKKYGMGHQHMEDTMRPLSFQVLSGKLQEHPFGEDEGRAASKYLAEHVYSAIEEVIHLPAQAMSFLQRIAKVCAHEGKPVRWVTPIGLPWINRYHEVDVKRIALWMHDRGIAVKTKTKLAVGDLKTIDKDRSANGIAPNLVHSLDAAHLVWVVRAAVREGVVGLATVHDSFGCLASRAGRFRNIIREQFVALYEQHDPLTEVLEQATCDLSVDSCGRLPCVPVKGPLNIKEVLHAEFAFA